MPLSASLFSNQFAEPVFLTASPGDNERLFVVERGGAIQIANRSTGSKAAHPFLVQHGLATDFNEQGLLGLAFHPNYATNGFFFVYYTAADRALTVSRYRVSGNSDIADANSGQVLLRIPKRPDGPFLNHNGGWMGFRPTDGYLYIAVGDGGPLSGRDPDRHGQNLSVLFGKLLRVDAPVSAPVQNVPLSFAVPPGNPFAHQAGARPEIWAFGLRNPWRCSFDRETGDLYIADVGQDRREEVNFEPANCAGGCNYGWRAKEGTVVTNLEPNLPPNLIDPIFEYDHNNGGVAIIGGYVYRGQAVPELRGKYVFADYQGIIFVLERTAAGAQVRDVSSELFADGPPLNISSFGEDGAGELYLITLDQGIYRFVHAD